MDKETFWQHLQQATEDVLCHTRLLVTDNLPSDCRYLVSCSERGRVAQGDLARVLDLLGPALDASAVVEKLWSMGKVPEWINIIVHGADARCTYLLLRCSVSTATLKEVPDNGKPYPFSLRLPSPPSGWTIRNERGLPDRKKSLETNGKYTIRNFDALTEERRIGNG